MSSGVFFTPTALKQLLNIYDPCGAYVPHCIYRYQQGDCQMKKPILGQALENIPLTVITVSQMLFPLVEMYLASGSSCKSRQCPALT
jgi:hypothetical protein